MKVTKNWPLLTSVIIGTSCFIYQFISICYYLFTHTDNDSLFRAVFIIGIAVLILHSIFLIIAAIFSWKAYKKGKKSFALAAAIFYIISTIPYFWSFVYTVPATILSFIGYAKLNKEGKDS